MKMLPTLPKRSYVVVVTLITLLCLFAYYFWVYLPAKEELLIAKRMRSLQQTATNFKAKEEVYRKTANTIYEKIKILQMDNERVQMMRRRSIQAAEAIQYFNTFLKREAVNTELELVDTARALRSGEIEYQASGLKDYGIKLVGRAASIFAKLRKDEVFDHHILLKNNKLAYSTVEGEVLQLVNSSSSRLFNIDSLLNAGEENTTRLQFDRLQGQPDIYEPGVDVRLSAVDYKLFSTRFQTDENTYWTLYALVDAERFEAATKEVSAMIMIVIAVILLILIFALPLLKLSLISSIERLHRVDVVLSTTSFVVCTGLMVLFVLFSLSYQSDRQKIDQQLKTLSLGIERDVESSLSQIMAQLDTLEKAAYAFAPLHSHTDINIFSDPNLCKLLSPVHFLKNLYWMDDQGVSQYQLSTITVDNKNLESVSFKGRPYFYEIAEGRGWKSRILADKLVEKRPFYLQSIASWTNSEKLLVLSLPSSEDTIRVQGMGAKKVNVVAASLRFHSLIDPLLPVAYSFSVIDQGGQVLFHSDKNKNLQENLLTETDSHSGLRSAISGKNTAFANVQNGDQSQRILIRPLKHTPWLLVTAYDDAYNESPYLQVISLSVICILIIGAMAFMQLFLISLFNRNPTKLKRQPFYYNWLWPVEENHLGYQKIMLYNIILSVALMLYISSQEFNVLQVLATFFYAVLLSGTSSWLMLSSHARENSHKTKIVLGVTLLSCLFIYTITSYFTYNGQNHYGFAEVVRGYAANLNTFLLVLGIALLPYLPLKRLQQYLNNVAPFMGFRHSYRAMLFTYLFISSVLPAYFIFTTAYQQEQSVWKKHEMYKISQAEEARNQLLKGLYLSAERTEDERSHYASTYGSKDAHLQTARSVGKYYQQLGYSSCDCKDTRAFVSSRWDSLVHQSRPYFSNMFVASNGFVYAKGGEEWDTQRCAEHGIRMKYSSIHPSVEDSVVLATVSNSLNWNYSAESMLGELFWVLLVALLLGVYFTVFFATDKFFALDVFDNLQAIQVDDTYLENYFSKDYFKDGHKHLFVIAMPFAGTNKLYGQSHLKVYDVPQLLDENESASVMQIFNSQVVLEHFSYVIEDIKANKLILDMVEVLLRNKNNIIIVSRLSPTQIIDKYEELISQTSNPEQRAELEVHVSKWKDILAGFVKVFYSLLHEHSAKQYFREDFSIKELLKYEFRVNEPYFSRVRDAFAREWNESDFELAPSLEAIERQRESHPLRYKAVKEEVILKIQSMAQPFYFSLWNTCSKEEKYLLYDLAMDGFVNLQNERGLKKLLEKGLIYYNQSLQVMNESFRNFILTTIKESESLAMEKELRRSGTWSLYSSVFLLLLLSLMVFIAFSQQEILSQFVALLVGLTTAVPYLLRFSGFFSALGGKAKLLDSN